MTGQGNTVVRGGVGKFYAYVPVVLDLTHQQSGVLTLYPDAHDHRPEQPGAAAGS